MNSWPLRRLLAATGLTLVAGVGMAAEMPGADAKPLSQLLEAVESRSRG